MISTDKAVNPTNVMGASKRLAEIYVQSLGLAISNGEHEGQTRFITTRFGNVLGSNGSVIPRFREQLAKGGPLTVTHPDIIRYFMTIPEACRLVLEAACMGVGNEIFVFDMGEPVKIVDLARRMIELAGLEPDKDIQISYTGLRPGEKLYEELLASKENSQPTPHDKIFRARVREYNHRDFSRSLLILCENAEKEARFVIMLEKHYLESHAPIFGIIK
jgi:FlaA1/EpsC-like NDP-sugar epimerase